MHPVASRMTRMKNLNKINTKSLLGKRRRNPRKKRNEKEDKIQMKTVVTKMIPKISRMSCKIIHSQYPLLILLMMILKEMRRAHQE